MVFVKSSRYSLEAPIEHHPESFSKNHTHGLPLVAMISYEDFSHVKKKGLLQ